MTVQKHNLLCEMRGKNYTCSIPIDWTCSVSSMYVLIITTQFFLAMPALIKMRKVWTESRDASKALSELGRRTGIERHLLIGLTKCKENDLVTAIAHVRNT